MNLLRLARNCFLAVNDKFLEQFQTQLARELRGIEVLFHPLDKFVNVRRGFLGFFESLFEISHALFQLGLFGGVFFY